LTEGLARFLTEGLARFLTEGLARFLTEGLARFLTGKLARFLTGKLAAKKNHLKCNFFERELQKQAQLPVFIVKILMSIFLVKDDSV
jgi:hypothetical protein